MNRSNMSIYFSSNQNYPFFPFLIALCYTCYPIRFENIVTCVYLFPESLNSGSLGSRGQALCFPLCTCGLLTVYTVAAQLCSLQLNSAFQTFWRNPVVRYDHLILFL